MALREKFGRLVLLEETEAGAVGREYRAARLGPAGLDRLVTVLRLSPRICEHAEATKRLIEEARLAARLQNPGLVRVLGIGRVEQSFYVSTELVEGRSVAAVLERCRGDGFPFAADHALMIASRGASALESLHARKDEGGKALMHGLFAPSRVVVAFDGEVKIKGLGLWPALRSADLLPPEESRYLAPEQAEGEMGGPRSDVYAFGLVLLEALTGRAPAGDPLEALADARVANAAGERTPITKALSELLRRALAREPASRFSGAADLRNAVDALLFSGDFAPTTFDLAFFMHTLFREEMEAETRALEEARLADYREFLHEEKQAAPTPAPEAGPPPAVPAAEAPAGSPPPTPVATVSGPMADRPPSGPGAESSDSRTPVPRPPREATARDAAARMTLGSAVAPPQRRRGLWLMLGLVVAVVGGGGGGYLYVVKRSGPSSAPTTLRPEETAAQARVRELEARIAQLEREKLQAETAAADEARRNVEAQAGGRPVDAAAIQRIQEEARRRARAEQEQKQRVEMTRLAGEMRTEEQRIAEASPAARAETPAGAPSAPVPTPAPTPAVTIGAPSTAMPTAKPTATPTPSPAPATETPPASASPAGGASTTRPSAAAGSPPASAPTTAVATPLPSPAGASVTRGALVDVNDPAVTPPAPVRAPGAAYPELARQARVEGVVELRALVDENGSVIEVTLVRCSRPGYRFEAEAERATRGRKYRPATKGGVPVRVWLPIVVNFKIPR